MSQPVTTSAVPKGVIVLGVVSLLSDISSEMIYPLMPSYLVDKVGASGGVVGFIEGLAAGVVCLLTVWSGWKSDTTSQRVKYIRIGYGLPVIGKTLFLVGSSWVWIFWGRLVDRIGKGFRISPRDVFIANSVDLKVRGKAFGFHRAMVSLGASLGVFIALILMVFVKEAISYRIVFIVALLFAILSALMTIFLTEQEVSSPFIKSKSKLNFEAVFSLGDQFWKTLAVYMLFAFANSSDFFLLLRFKDLVLSATLVVAGYGIYQVVYTVFSFSAGTLSDKVGRWPLIRTGWFIYAVVYGSFAFTNLVPFQGWILISLYGVYLALTEAATSALIVENVEESKRGTALGVFYFFMGLASVTSNALCGLLWDLVGHHSPFIVGSSFAAMAILASYFISIKNHN